ncbi:hypothetical protein FHG87_007821 [Trinorchestia longiramus]|nr:hypothetical protein FHG87_007821 [Trinorchestia longiramus]
MKLVSIPQITEAVHSAAQHIHLLVDGRNKFVTKGTTYEDVKAQFIDRASVCSYYIEKVVEPEPEETDQGVEEEVQQLAPELEAAQLNQVQDKSEGEVGCPSEEADVEEDIAVNEATQAMNHAAELPSAAIVPLEKTEDHLAISSAGPVPLDASAAVYMIRDPTQHPPPPPGLQPHPQQAAAPLLMGQGLPQQQAMQSQEAFAAALTQQQQQQHMHVMYQLEQQQQLEHQQHLEQQQQQHLLQQREQQQQQQQQQLEEEHDDGSSIHNDSIKDLLTLSDFNFLQESVIDKPTAATGSPAPSVSEAAVYMDPAIVSVVSIGSVNPAESVIVPASEPLVAPVDHFIAAAAAAAAAPPPQAPQPQLSLAGPPPPVVTSQKLSHASNNLATIPTPNFPPTVPPPTTSLANVPPPPVHASNARPPPSSHPLEPEQFFSHAPPPPPHTASYQADNLNYSAPPPPPTAAAPAPQTSLTPTLDNTPNPPPPIPLPQEHTSSSWDQPSQNWVDDQPQMNGGGQTSPSNGAEVQQSASSDWSAAPVEEKSRHSNRSWGSEEGDNIAGNWGSDVRSPPRGPQMSQQDDYDRKMGGVNNSYRNGPHHRMRRDGGELEDYGGHDDGGYWGDEDYDDRRGGMYARGRGGRGRINNNHNGGGGYRGRGGYNGNGYQNGRGGYGPQGGFRSRGGMGGPTGGGFRGMRGANRGGSGMPRGGGGNAGGAYRSSRGNYPVQRPYYGQ